MKKGLRRDERRGDKREEENTHEKLSRSYNELTAMVGGGGEERPREERGGEGRGEGKGGERKGKGMRQEGTNRTGEVGN